MNCDVARTRKITVSRCLAVYYWAALKLVPDLQYIDQQICVCGL